MSWTIKVEIERCFRILIAVLVKTLIPCVPDGGQSFILRSDDSVIL